MPVTSCWVTQRPQHLDLELAIGGASGSGSAHCQRSRRNGQFQRIFHKVLSLCVSELVGYQLLTGAISGPPKAPTYAKFLMWTVPLSCPVAGSATGAIRLSLERRHLVLDAQPESFHLLHFLLPPGRLAIVDQTIQFPVLQFQRFQIILHDVLLDALDKQDPIIDLIEMKSPDQFMKSIA